MPHFVWSATTVTRRAACTKARLVSASARLGVVSPATGSMPWQPRKSRSTCRERIAMSAIGPTSASEGVRTPPVSTTCGVAPNCPAARADPEDARHPHRVGHDRQPGHIQQLLGQGERGRPRGQGDRGAGRDQRRRPPGRWPPSAAVPGTDLASNPGSWLLGEPGSTAPPCTFSISPARARASRSRRMVMSDTPRRCVRSLTRALPARRMSSRISDCRCLASILDPPYPLGRDRRSALPTCDDAGTGSLYLVR